MATRASSASDAGGSIPWELTAFKQYPSGRPDDGSICDYTATTWMGILLPSPAQFDMGEWYSAYGEDEYSVIGTVEVAWRSSLPYPPYHGPWTLASHPIKFYNIPKMIWPGGRPVNHYGVLAGVRDLGIKVFDWYAAGWYGFPKEAEDYAAFEVRGRHVMNEIGQGRELVVGKILPGTSPGYQGPGCFQPASPRFNPGPGWVTCSNVWGVPGSTIFGGSASFDSGFSGLSTAWRILDSFGTQKAITSNPNPWA